MARCKSPQYTNRNTLDRCETVFLPKQLIQNELPPGSTQEPPGMQKPYCYRCNISIDGHLVRCISCEKYFCHGESVDVPGGDPDRLLSPCVQLNKLISEHSVQTFEQIKSAFRCPRCWDHAQGLYPVSLLLYPPLGFELPLEN